MARLREDTVTLSAGSIWPWQILAEPGDAWPLDAPAYTRFKNTAGAELAVIAASDVTAAAITFLAQPEDVDDIPAGASFETFIDTSDGPFKIRFGTVLRREARATQAQTLTQTVSRQFSDTFQRTALGWRWEPVSGSKNTVKIYDNSAGSLPNGVGPNTPLLPNRIAAIRYYQPLAGDSVRSSFTVVIPPEWGGNNGRLVHVVCADQNFSTGLGIRVDSVTDTVQLCRVTSPNSVVLLGASASYVAVNNDSFTIDYDDLTNTTSIFRGASTTPLAIPFVDASHVIVHGPGHRYLGFMHFPTATDTGPQASGWSAKDEV